MSTTTLRRLATAIATLAATTALAGCAGTTPTEPAPAPPAGSMNAEHGGHGMESTGGMSMPSGTGLADTVNGYTLALRTPPAAGQSGATFAITKDGAPVTAFDPEQTKLMHFYLIRSDLTGFQHLHPEMSPDGTWTAPTAAVGPGDYRAYVQFVPHADAAAGALILSTPLTVQGAASPAAALPAATSSTVVDGYQVALTGAPKAGVAGPLTITITRDGRPVTDLQPYLDTYAHVTAIHQGDLAFAHLHPEGTVAGDRGGPSLTLHAELPSAGNYRMFVQFQTGGTLHTAPITVAAS